MQKEFLESPQWLCPTAQPLPKGDDWTSSSCCRNQEALFPVVCWTIPSWVFPRNDQMRGIWGNAGQVPGEGWWERRGARRMEVRGRGGKGNWGTVGPGIPLKTLLPLAVVLLGDTQAQEDHLTCFMQTYWWSMTNQLPRGILRTMKWKMSNYDRAS